MRRERAVKRLALIFALMSMQVGTNVARAQQPVMRVVPLAFGMNAEQASQALGVPLSYVHGRPGEELLFALPNVKGTTLASRSDGLYLQFRKGRLTGWKGDWGTIRP
jgi:hypothetical protein